MRRMRDRQRQGKVCLMIELDPWEISGLIALRWLDRNRRSNPVAVRDAFGRFVSIALDIRKNPDRLLRVTRQV
jgi:hypothetical protein